MFIGRCREQRWNSLPDADQQRFFFCKLACHSNAMPSMIALVIHSVKISILICAFMTAASLSLRAGTSAQEKAFIDKYKTAFEGKDTATLESFLDTQDADSAILGFYKMMQSAAGEKISKID